MNATETDFLSLEKLLRDECKCESGHDKGRVNCSGNVTHRCYSLCGPALLWCNNMATHILKTVKPTDRCNDCDRYVLDCWTIIPV